MLELQAKEIKKTFLNLLSVTTDCSIATFLCYLPTRLHPAKSHRYPHFCTVVSVRRRENPAVAYRLRSGQGARLPELLTSIKTLCPTPFASLRSFFFVSPFLRLQNSGGTSICSRGFLCDDENMPLPHHSRSGHADELCALAPRPRRLTERCLLLEEHGSRAMK